MPRVGFRRSLCSSLDAFQDLLDDGLGVHGRLAGVEGAICNGLSKRGWCVLDGVLTKEQAARIRAEATGVYRDGRYTLSYSRVAETGEKIWR